MRVNLLTDYCLGHGLCCAAAPEVFGLDDAGLTQVLTAGDIPEPLQKKAHAAAAVCPERAIVVES
jgi:ferredoxin